MSLTEGLDMGLADSLNNAMDNTAPKAVCSVHKARKSMKKEDLAVFDAALLNRSIPATVLGRALRDENIDVTAGTITRHRNGWCKTCGAE
jgi:hypothetical protein